MLLLFVSLSCCLLLSSQIWGEAYVVIYPHLLGWVIFAIWVRNNLDVWVWLLLRALNISLWKLYLSCRQWRGIRIGAGWVVGNKMNPPALNKISQRQTKEQFRYPWRQEGQLGCLPSPPASVIISSHIRNSHVIQSLSHVRLSAAPWTVASQDPLSMGFSRQENRVGCHFLLHKQSHGIIFAEETN